MSDRIKSALKSHIITCFKSLNTLKSKLVQKEKRSNLVYGITCGNANYVGQTKQSEMPDLNNTRCPTSFRLKIRQFVINKWKQVTLFGTENTFILDNEEQWHRRGIKETIVWKRVETPSLNRNGELPYLGQTSE